MNNWYRIMIKNAEEIKGRILYIMRSPSGGGKSFLAKELGKGGVVFSTDDFWYRDGKYQFDINKLGTAHKWNYERAKKAAQQGISPIVIDNTNTVRKDFLQYIELGLEYGYDVKFAEPNWHPELKTPEGKWNYDFIMKLQEERRKKEPSKVIPPEAVKRMIDRYEYQKPGETDEQFMERMMYGDKK